jgi:DNA (cytosine-5)-methyltransferase 1
VRVFSTFSGISSASVAWKPLGWEFVGYAEPAPFPAAVLHHRLGATSPIYRPDHKDFAEKQYAGISGGTVRNFGDVSQVSDEDLASLGDVDILEGGPPCQGFSLAGLRGGFSDPRGNLTLAFAQLALRMRRINNLKYIVMENVHGFLSHKDNPLGCILAAFAGDEEPLQPPGDGWSNAGHMLAEDGTSAAWRILNSENFGLAQRRRRIFVVVSFDPDRDAGEILFEQEGEGWSPEPIRETWQGPVGCSDDGSGIVVIGRDSKMCIGEGRAFTITSSEANDPQTVVYPIQNAGRLGAQGGTGIADANDPMFTLLADHYHGVIHPRVVGTIMACGAGTSRPASAGNEMDFVIVEDAPAGYIARRLMPCETESLQGFPMGWTDVPFKGEEAPDSKRYHAVGNSISTPVLAWLGHRITLQHVDIVPWDEDGIPQAA